MEQNPHLTDASAVGLSQMFSLSAGVPLDRRQLATHARVIPSAAIRLLPIMGSPSSASARRRPAECDLLALLVAEESGDEDSNV
jgi:hypothetical protein